jgi:ATP-binding cassette subfamily F protein 3
VNRRDRIGLVGPNGVGKTTLLLILAGLTPPTSGSIHRAEGMTLGYLRQEAVLTFAGQENTVYQEMLSVFSDLRQMETQLRRMEAAMAAGETSEELLQAYGRLQEQYELGGGYGYQVEIRRVLDGLGFPADAWDTPLTHLSGGQKTRVLLGRLLLEKPDLLILDEPTNHLDMAAIEWLEGTLRRWQGALIIVSHDRYFLDRVINQVWEMRRGDVLTYRGNYTAFVRQRREAWERAAALFKREKERMTEELDWIKRHMAGGKSDIAKGRLKRLTRDIVLIEEHGVAGIQGKQWMEIGERVRSLTANEAARRLRRLQPPDDRPPRLNIRLDSEERSERVALRGKGLEIGYPGTPLFTVDEIELERHDCAALIGPNGSGKTTFLRVLNGDLPPLDGHLYWGENVQRGYFAQAHDQLDLSHRVIDEIQTHASMSDGDARHYLAQYLFRGDDVFKSVGALSGGERGRLALAVLALQEANFLLLDEPTNHLDIPSQEILQEVLEGFDGAMLLVSHDRYLVDRLATQIWELREGELHVFEGTYAEFLAARQAADKETADDETGSKVALPDSAPEEAPPPPDMSWVASFLAEQEAAEAAGQKRPSRAPVDLDMRLGELDEEIEEAEMWLADLEYQLETAVDPQERAQLESEIAAAEAELDALTTEWDDLMAEE